MGRENVVCRSVSEGGDRLSDCVIGLPHLDGMEFHDMYICKTLEDGPLMHYQCPLFAAHVTAK